jgi:predicted DNA-binding protein
MATETHEVRPLHILIPTELHARLQALAKANDRSMAAETRLALEGRLKEFESQGAAA